MTKIEVAKLVAIVLGAWPSAHVTSKTSTVYESALADLEYVTAQLAIDRLIKTARFLPSIAEIREMELEVRMGPQRLGGEAWGDVVAAIRRIGAYHPPPIFEDPCVAECVRLMSWRALCLGENEAADRARFVELYNGLQKRARLDAAAGRELPAARGLAALPGAAE